MNIDHEVSSDDMFENCEPHSYCSRVFWFV